jgi:IS605 OrfB family transposase
MKQIDTDFSSFFAASKAYKKDPSKFQGFPRPPNYKHKKGRSTLTFNIQTISGKWLKKGYLLLSGLTEPIKLNVQPDKIKEARIVPGQGGYKVEVVYKIKETKKKTTGTYKAGLDPGVNIMAAIVTNKKGENTFTISGGPIKSINQFYNKRKAELQSEFDLTNSNRRMKEIEKELDRLFWKRFHKIEDYLHKSSSALVNQLVSSGVDELVIGNNPEWKQEANMKRVENQNFCMFPHDRFYKKLEYKCELVGIKVKYEQEAYTSKCSFLDMEEIGKHEKYAGKRIKRGLFKSSKGIKINADVNGSGNILRKGIDGAFDQWSEAELIEGFVVNPIRLVVDPVRERTGKKFQRQKCH